MHQPAPTDLRAAARALLRTTAQAWDVEMAMACPAPVRAAPARPSAAAPRLWRRSAGRRGNTPADISAQQWPYWPALPGLAAHWR